MWFIIGSRAANAVFPNFYRSIENSDWDLYTTNEEFIQWLNTKPIGLKSCFRTKGNKYRLFFDNTNTMEVGIYDTNALYLFVEKHPEIHSPIVVTVPNIGAVTALSSVCLTLLKKSHLHWNIHWDKNYADFSWLKGHCNIDNLSPIEEQFYLLAYEKMSEIHKNKKSKNIVF
jgi:arsenate reductase-like glutaredoxin family protein